MWTYTRKTLLTLLFLATLSALISEGSGQDVLLLVKQGSNINVLDIWNTVGGVNDGHANGSSELITNLFPLVPFRSQDVDLLMDIPPEKIFLQAVDNQGNVLWVTDFLTTSLRNYTNLSALITAGDIDGQFSYFPPGDVSVFWSNANHQMAIQPLTDTTTAYFSIWDDPSSTDYPVFLFPKPNSTPRPLQKGTPGVYEYSGCYASLHMNITIALQNSPSMSLDLCADACAPTSTLLLAIEKNINCWCGGFSTSKLSGLPYDNGKAHCSTYLCTGTTDLCGGALGLYAVYAATSVPIPASEPEIPQPTASITVNFIYNKEILVDISQHASLPVYIKRIRLHDSDSLMSGTFVVFYNQHSACNSTERKLVMDYTRNDVKVFRLKSPNIIGMLEASCIWIRMADTVLGLYFTLTLHHVDHGETFISAPYIAVVGQRRATPEATSITTTAATTDTTTTTTESTTTSTSTVFGPVVTAQPTTTDTAASTSTTAGETSTVLTTYVTSSANICTCRCYKTFTNMTREELVARLKALRHELSVNVTELSSYIRKFISAPDDRASAAGVGAVGVAILAFVLGTVVVLDLTTFLKLKK